MNNGAPLMKNRWRKSVAVGFLIAAVGGVLAMPGAAWAAEAPAGGGQATAHESEAGAVQTLPMKTTVLPDGTRIATADPKAVKALTDAAAKAGYTGCQGNCDLKSPDEWITPPGGPNNWYKCSWDAQTVKEAWAPWNPGYREHIELRYSPRCRSAWARSSSTVYFKVNSYYMNGNFRTYADSGVDPTQPRYTTWTAMLNDANLLANACYWTYAEGETCTSKY